MPGWPRPLVFYPKDGVLSTADICTCPQAWHSLISNTLYTASTAWGTANLALYTPVMVDVPMTVYKLAVNNGATVNGNTDVGIYDERGKRLVSSTPTLQAGISTMQVFDIADTILVPGIYYLALASTSTTGTYLCASATVSRNCGSGMSQQTGLTSGTLPNPATLGTRSAQNFAPLITASYNVNL